MTTVLENPAGRYKSLQRAAAELGVSRHTVGWYMHELKLTSQKFQFDRNRYMAIEDFQRLKALRDARVLRRQ